MKQMTVMKTDDHTLMLTLCENLVPLKWRKLWSGPKLTTDYLKAITTRANEAHKRLTNESQLNFGQEIDFKSIFNVDGFFAALKLANARQFEISACDLVLKVDFNSNKVSNHNDSSIWVMVQPIMIDGAHFENNKLIIAKNSNKILSDKSPSFQVTFQKLSSRILPSSDTYDLPLYSNASRETLITNLPVQISDSRVAIVYSGAALIVPDF